MLQRASSLQRPPGPVPTISQSNATTADVHGELRPLAEGLASEEKPLSASQLSPGPESKAESPGWEGQLLELWGARGPWSEPAPCRLLTSSSVQTPSSGCSFSFILAILLEFCWIFLFTPAAFLVWSTKAFLHKKRWLWRIPSLILAVFPLFSSHKNFWEGKKNQSHK